MIVDKENFVNDIAIYKDFHKIIAHLIINNFQISKIALFRKELKTAKSNLNRTYSNLMYESQVNLSL